MVGRLNSMYLPLLEALIQLILPTFIDFGLNPVTLISLALATSSCFNLVLLYIDSHSKAFKSNLAS